MRQPNPRALLRTGLRILARCTRLRDDDRGQALVELALVLSFLGVPLLLGTAQMGLLIHDSIEVADAANAGALYAMQNNADASLTSVITSTAQAEAPDVSSLTVTPTPYYACTSAVGGTQYVIPTYTSTQAAAMCTGGGNHALEFIQVQTSATVTPLIHFPGLPSSYTLKGQAVMEVEQ